MKLTEDSNNIIKFIKSNFYNTEYKLSKTNIKFFTNILKLANKALNKWQDMKKMLHYHPLLLLIFMIFHLLLKMIL